MPCMAGTSIMYPAGHVMKRSEVRQVTIVTEACTEVSLQRCHANFPKSFKDVHSGWKDRRARECP